MTASENLLSLHRAVMCADFRTHSVRRFEGPAVDSPPARVVPRIRRKVAATPLRPVARCWLRESLMTQFTLRHRASAQICSPDHLNADRNRPGTRKVRSADRT
jgi:hypothetical protein